VCRWESFFFFPVARLFSCADDERNEGEAGSENGGYDELVKTKCEPSALRSAQMVSTLHEIMGKERRITVGVHSPLLTLFSLREYLKCIKKKPLLSELECRLQCTSHVRGHDFSSFLLKFWGNRARKNKLAHSNLQNKTKEKPPIQTHTHTHT
jgi:hypothetical protein